MSPVTKYLSEFVYALIGALLGFLLIKMDDVFNNKQYTRKEYSKVVLACYLATLSGLFVMKAWGPVKMPAVDAAFTPIQIPITQSGGNSTPVNIIKPAIPSSGTAFFQPTGGANMAPLKFSTGVPTF